MMFNKYSTFFLIPFCLALLSFRPDKAGISDKFPGDSLSNPDYIYSLIKYSNYYPFIRYNINYIEWAHSSAMDTFYNRLYHSKERKIRVLHIGDSHVQADIGTGHVRDNLQKILGYGGRGIVFPYRAANTHSAWDYRTFADGEWSNSKNIDKDIKFDIGISGVTIHTEDTTANFKIVFRKNSIRKNCNVVKLFFKKSPESFGLKFKASSVKDTLLLSCDNNSKPFIEIKLPESADTLYFSVNKTSPEQRFFELYGLCLETESESGILYSSVGINGAGYRSILSQTLFSSQLHYYKPDLVIIDLGANDFYKGNFNYPVMEKMLVTIIKSIKSGAPEASIIINSSQNIYKRTTNIEGCIDFTKLIRNIAIKYNCAFYDYFAVAGGNKSMLNWLSAGLAKKDKVHLTNEGYRVKAELFTNAILNSYLLKLNNKISDSLYANNYMLDTARLAELFPGNPAFSKNLSQKNITAKTENVTYINTTVKTYYKIKSGDNLQSIANKYHVSVSDIRHWNNLRNNKIIAGKKLIIYTKQKTKQNNNNLPAQNHTSSPKEKNVTPVDKNPSKTKAVTKANASSGTHKVTKGENLWAIARKHNTTVEKIKKLNNLSNENIKPGMILKVK